MNMLFKHSLIYFGGILLVFIDRGANICYEIAFLVFDTTTFLVVFCHFLDISGMCSVNNCLFLIDLVCRKHIIIVSNVVQRNLVAS